MKKFTSLLLILVLIFSVATPTLAKAADQPTPRYANISTFAGDLSISSSAVASCYGYVSASSYLPVKVVVKLQIYQGGDWVTEKTWTSTGMAAAGVSETYNLAYGNNYRVEVTGYVYDNNGNELERDSLTDAQYCPWPTRNVE